MSKRLAKIKARKIITDYYVVPRDWNNKAIKNWFSANEDVELTDRDIEVISLNIVPRGSSVSIAQMVERGDFKLDKPRLVG